jgi:hypothetical protein
VAYLVGRNGATRQRLEAFSGCRLNIDRDCAEVEGSPESRELAKLAIKITLQQRSGGVINVNFDDIELREDVSTFDVPKDTVGFLLGKQGFTLRQMETKYRVFMFFNNDRLRQGKHGECKRLYVIGRRQNREDALDEAEDVVRKFKDPTIEYVQALDPQRRTYKQYEVKGIPHVVVLDPEGIVRWEGYPLLDGHELSEKVIEGLLPAKKG